MIACVGEPPPQKRDDREETGKNFKKEWLHIFRESLKEQNDTIVLDHTH